MNLLVGRFTEDDRWTLTNCLLFLLSFLLLPVFCVACALHTTAHHPASLSDYGPPTPATPFLPLPLYLSFLHHDATNISHLIVSYFRSCIISSLCSVNTSITSTKHQNALVNPERVL